MYERQIRESAVLTAHAEVEPEDDDDDDELMEVDVDASEVDQVLPVRIVKHQQYSYCYDPTGNGGLFCVWVKLEYSDGSRTNGNVSSTFLGDSEEGLALLRAYTKKKVVHTALKYMPWV